MSKTADEHKAKAPSTIGFALIIVSTSRFERSTQKEIVEDPTGDLASKILCSVGYSVVSKEIVSDDYGMIRETVGKALENPSVDVVVTCGGTGITSTDVTIETIKPLLEKELPGFGEIFRKISYDMIGSAAILTRTIAGLIKEKTVFCLPGSPQAVELALNKLILPETGHIVKHARD